MGNFRYKFAQFMMGRNGFDVFNVSLIKIILVMIVADLFAPGSVLGNLTLFLWIYIYFRAFSRNLTKRRAENQWYVTYVHMPLKSYLARDRKNYRYFKCPTCNQTLRAPKGKGKIRVTCSRCHNVFERKV